MPENDARQGEWWLRIDTPAIIYHPPEVEYYDWVAGIDDFVIVVLNSVQGLRRIAKADFYTLYQFASWYVPPAPMELQTSIAPVIMTDAVLSGSTLSIDPTYIERTVLELFGITREELPILRGFFRHTIEAHLGSGGHQRGYFLGRSRRRSRVELSYYVDQVVILEKTRRQRRLLPKESHGNHVDIATPLDWWMDIRRILTQTYYDA